MEVASPEHLLSLRSRAHLPARHIMSSTSRQVLAVGGAFLLFHFVFLIKIHREMGRKKKKKERKEKGKESIYFIILFFLMEQSPGK